MSGVYTAFSKEFVYLLQANQYVSRGSLGHRKHVVPDESNLCVSRLQKLSLDNTIALGFLERFLQEF